MTTGDIVKLPKNSSPTITQLSTLKVLTDIVTAMESSRLLESIYGFISEDGCRIVAVVDELTSEQSDAIWGINWEFQSRYPQLDIETLLIQRQGRPISELFSDGGSATVKREIVSA